MARSLQPSSAHRILAHYDKRESESDHVCVGLFVRDSTLGAPFLTFRVINVCRHNLEVEIRPSVNERHRAKIGASRAGHARDSITRARGRNRVIRSPVCCA